MSTVLEPSALMGSDRYKTKSLNALFRTAYFSHTFDRYQWELCLEKLRQMYLYEPDWNDEGAEPLNPDVISLAVVVAKSLRSNQPPPTQCIATDEGHVIFIWDEGGVYSEVEIDRELKCTVRKLRPGAKRADSNELNPYWPVV